MATSDFSVTIGQPTLVAPETPTPHEFKYLSNIDDQMGLRNHIPFIHVYRRPQNGPGCDPGPIIHQALSRALIHYYPLAGRLRNGGKEKLVVECTGEGMVYRDADADVTIELLRKANGGIRPPFRHLDRFLVNDVWGCNSIINSPLLRVQVLVHCIGARPMNLLDFVSSTVDFIEVNGRRGFCSGLAALVVSDMSRLRFADVDFGWGLGIYGGPARAGTGAVPGMVTSLVGYRREEDDREGLLALVSLPREAVVAFHREVRKIVMDGFAPEPVRSAL
ncbi:benzyl alcohol O-benzoyltransferase-like [Asparagus officinalis]|uniref:benzyl alcohol O-benzoyltransferase-like n=1 Tax=Asparagus officinalis TaxID=4686 RepID=UPI00098E6EFA|nr:benzyl alcohol O-benzoyltransferase-like [Asparagus officinalis]